MSFRISGRHVTLEELSWGDDLDACEGPEAEKVIVTGHDQGRFAGEGCGQHPIVARVAGDGFSERLGLDPGGVPVVEVQKG